jgi:hypothetical protein
MGNLGGMKIDKEKKRVVVFLDDTQIAGDIYLTPKTRLTDILNSTQTKDFIPITNATIDILSTKQTLDIKLIEINKNKIKTIFFEADINK